MHIQSRARECVASIFLGFSFLSLRFYSKSATIHIRTTKLKSPKSSGIYSGHIHVFWDNSFIIESYHNNEHQWLTVSYLILVSGTKDDSKSLQPNTLRQEEFGSLCKCYRSDLGGLDWAVSKSKIIPLKKLWMLVL